MLSTNLPVMKANLNMLLTPSEGNPIYDAAYNAYYDANKSDMPAINDDPLGNQSTSAMQIVNDTNEKIKDCAKKFAASFCDSLKSGGFMDSIADEIDNHVKAIKLMINIPTLLPTIVSPMGPCTGALSITEETGAQIQIL